MVSTYCSGDWRQIAYLVAEGTVEQLEDFSHTLEEL